LSVRKLSIWLIADLISPGALVGMAIGRVGCVFNGCCYGLTTSLPWAVEYSCPTSYAPLGVPLHPTQMYHIIWNLIAFAILWSLRRRLKPQGSVFLIYLAFYAAGDLLIRIVREGDPFLFGLQQAQVIGIVVLIITLPWLFVRMWLYRKKRPDS
jgi:phosphatidylglycerol:prolipoprotein diacylglycerol transferase